MAKRRVGSVPIRSNPINRTIVLDEDGYDWYVPASNVDPVFQNIFDVFLTHCVNDTVNNGDSLLEAQAEREHDQELKRESLDDRGWADEGTGMIGGPDSEEDSDV